MHGNQLDGTQTVSEWAKNRPRVSRVFEKHAIDLCRDGNKSVIQVCRDREIAAQQMIEELRGAIRPAHREMGSDWEHASIGELCEHVEIVHHFHLRRGLRWLGVLLPKVVDAYLARHPELDDLQRSFGRFRSALEWHLLTETTLLLPEIRALGTDHRHGDSPAERLTTLVNRLEDDHVVVDDELRHVRRLTHGYALPPDACATYGAMLDGLWELEWHLHTSIYEEEEILFPKVLRHQAALLEE